MCDMHGQSLVALTFGLVGVGALALAVSTDFWLYTGEAWLTTIEFDNETFQETVEVKIHSGLWRACTYYDDLPGKDVQDKSEINPLELGRCGSNFKSVICKLILENSSLDTRYEITLRWMAQDLTIGKSTLIQVIGLFHQAAKHFLIQCWPRSMGHIASLDHIELMKDVKMYP